MKLRLSKIWATVLSFIYDGDIYFHHINSNGYWEFEIGYKYPYGYDLISYKTKGLR